MGTSDISFFAPTTCVNGHPEYEVGQPLEGDALSFFDASAQATTAATTSPNRLTEMGKSGPGSIVVMHEAEAAEVQAAQESTSKPGATQPHPDPEIQAVIDKGMQAIDKIRSMGGKKVADAVEWIFGHAVETVRDPRFLDGTGFHTAGEQLKHWADWADRTAGMTKPRDKFQRTELPAIDWQAVTTQIKEALPSWVVAVGTAGILASQQGRMAAAFLALYEAADFTAEPQAPKYTGPLI